MHAAELAWTSTPDEQLKQGMLSAGLSPEQAGLIVEMGRGMQQGRIMNEFFHTDGQVTGEIKLEDFAETFKARYQQVSLPAFGYERP